MDLDLLTTTLEALGEPAYRRRQAQQGVLRELVGGWGELTTLPESLRRTLDERVPFSVLTVDHEQASTDGSRKLRLLTVDGFPVEAVLMRFDSPARTSAPRLTACLSSQSGCALACTFCATGAMGLGRSLTRWEIVDQLLELMRRAGERVDNVVMMGMGEPFQNYDEVLAACRVMNDPEGLALAARRIAISTAGWVPGIERLASEPLQVKLALSLHAPNDELRSRLMPVTKRYPVAELMRACREYRRHTRRRIFVEYLMLDGVNDSVVHARELARLLGGDGFHVNLIAYNPTGGTFAAASSAAVQRFAAELQERGVRSSYRVSRGRDIDAACGQLAAPVAAARAARRAKRNG